MPSRSYGYRAPLLWLVLPFIGGLVAGKAWGPFSVAWTLGPAVVTGIAAAFMLRRTMRGWAILLVATLVASGMSAYALARDRLSAWDALPPREAHLSLRMDRVFAAGDARRASGLATVVKADPHLRELVGQRLYFSLALLPGEAAPVRTAVIETLGVLVTLPLNPPPDSFDGYLAGAGMNFRLTRGRVLQEEKPALAYYRFCARAAHRCGTILSEGIDLKRPALAGLLRALMLGDTHELSEEQHTLFMQSGTMHLFAISGLNIGVIAAAIHTLLALLRVPPWGRFGAGSVLLWLFVDITGAAPSAVRAFAMAVFFQAAGLLQRPANPVAALAVSALAVLVLSPLQVFGASFLMSYGIVLALIVLGLPLGEAWLAAWSPWRDQPKVTWNRWQRGVDHAWRTGASAVAVGVATTLVSWVTGVHFFRLLTPGALLANLALIPAAVVVTLTGFASLLFGLLGALPVAGLFNHSAALVLWGIEAIVRACVAIPGAFIPARFVPAWLGSTTLGLLIAALLAGYAGRWGNRTGRWWPPFAIVALALGCGVTFGST